MKTIYFDCSMGAAGDMLAAALLELLPDPARFIEEFNSIGLPHTLCSAEPSVKCGIRGTHFSVKVHNTEEDEHLHDHSHNHHHGHEHDHHHHHDHSSPAHIEHQLSHLSIPEEVRRDVSAVYGLLAEAEGHVHGVPVDQIHFHEVGTLDALADITAVCMLIHKLKPDRILASPVHVGSGQVRCAHGILPVPAPATAKLLQGIPIYSGDMKGELCTPTGAALLKHFVQEFLPMPTMTISSIGYGMGKKDFPAANCVRSILGEDFSKTEDIIELSCNLDDMTGEMIGFATELLMEQGALDVFTIPIGMKKNRPGILLCVLCREQLRESMVELLFRHTTTLGIREQSCHRYTMERSFDRIDTHYGSVRRKHATGYGVSRCKYEYDDLAQLARENKVSIAEILKELP